MGSLRYARALYAALAIAAGICACASFSETAPGAERADAAAEVGTPGSGSDAADCAVDVRTDPTNCGRCGHDCAGGGCIGGRCQPVPVSSSEVDLEEVRVSGARLLYRASESVRAVDVTGGVPSTIVGCANRAGLAVTSAGFYSWCDDVLTLRDVADAGVRGRAKINGYEVATSADSLFFREGRTLLFRTHATLSDAGEDDELETNGVDLRSLATTSSQLFYTTADGSIYVAPLAAGSGTLFEPNQATPSAIAADDDALFWATDTDSDAAVLHSRSFTEGRSSPLATGLDHPDRIAVDASHVYVTVRGTPPSYTNGAIVRVPRGGGAVEILATDQLLPHDIVVTDRSVIWTSRGTPTDAGGYTGGAIYRLAK